MCKFKIQLISFLIFGFFLQSFGQNSAEYEKFINKVYQFRPTKNVQKLSIPSQKFNRPGQKILNENPFINYQKLKNSLLTNSPLFNSEKNYSFLNYFPKQHLPMVPLTSTGVFQDWSQIYESKTLPSWDSATDIAVDKEGYAYVTGYSTNMQQGMDFYTIKYDTDGNQIWAVYFNGETNGDDLARKIALDEAGDVYVAGNSCASGTGLDLCVVKYNNQGQQQWVASYDANIYGDDELQDMVVDNLGNVYLIGSSNNNFATIKIDNNGIQQWAVQYSGPADYDYPMAAAIDITGNVYVTGLSKTDNHFDFATIKYNADGLQQWAKRYSSADSSDDIPKDIVVDKSGAVYVTGMRIINDKYDFLTIKYDSSGQELWTDIYDVTGNFLYDDFAETINLDDKGNIYVTGSSEDIGWYYDMDMVTIKYNSDGIRQWVARYRFGDNSNFRAVTAKLDSSGNIYVLGIGDSYYEGEDYQVVKYAPDGSQVWEAGYHNFSQSWVRTSAIVVTDRGEVFITGERDDLETGFDYITVKFNANGIQQWVRNFNGTYREDGEAVALQIDVNGDVIAFGGSGDKFVTTKYSAQGILKWAASFEGREYYSGTDKSLVLDASGNIFVITADRPDPSKWDYDFVTIKYNASGVQQWLTRYDTDECQEGWDRQNFPKAIVVDQAGNAYVTGRSLGQSGNHDIVTIKYSPDGVEQWVNRFSSRQNYKTRVTDLAIDKKGNIIVAGLESSLESALLIIKYDSNGRQRWFTITPNETSYFINAKIKVDDWNNIYVLSNRDKSCMLCSLADFDNSFILKYNSNGIKQWITECRESEGIFFGADIGIDLMGNVYVCGMTWGSDFRDQFVTKKYNADGIELWTARKENSGNWSFPRCLELDRENNVYVAGDFGKPGVGSDAQIVKYNSSGKKKWAISYGDPRNTSDITRDMKVDRQGIIFLAGSANGMYWSNFKIMKFSQTGADTFRTPVIAGYELKHNIPNPFKTQTLIYYMLPKASKVKIKVFNQLGQQVAFKNLGIQVAGKHAYHFRTDDLPSGVYFYRLKAGNFVKTRKMVLIQ